MSRHHIEKVTCPSCHHEGDFELWDSINSVPDFKISLMMAGRAGYLFYMMF